MIPKQLGILCHFHKTVQSIQSPKRRKFALSGHSETELHSHKNDSIQITNGSFTRAHTQATLRYQHTYLL
jgi:hypothetical protein